MSDVIYPTRPAKCHDCRYGVFGDDPKDAYASLLRKDDNNDAQ